MTVMKTRDIRKMSIEEVRVHLREAEEEVFRLRFRAATEQLESPIMLRHRRRDIARMVTIIREHEQGVRTLAQRESVEGATS